MFFSKQNNENKEENAKYIGLLRDWISVFLCFVFSIQRKKIYSTIKQQRGMKYVKNVIFLWNTQPFLFLSAVILRTYVFQ